MLLVAVVSNLLTEFRVKSNTIMHGVVKIQICIKIYIHISIHILEYLSVVTNELTRSGFVFKSKCNFPVGAT